MLSIHECLKISSSLMALYFLSMFMSTVHIKAVFLLRYDVVQKPYRKIGTLSFFLPNPSSGSVSGHWFSPEGLNFVGVNC